MHTRFLIVALVVVCLGGLALAEDPTEPMTNWSAPPYWTPPAGGQLREHLTATEATPENQGVSTESASSTSPILPFTAITPCRLVDTRQSPDTPYLDNGGAGETRTYHFDTTIPYTGTGACSLIPTAAALSLSVQFQVTDHQASLIAYPDDVTRPLVASVVAYNTGLFYMNSAIVPTGADGGIKVFAQWGGQVVININGYYAPSNIVTTLNSLSGDVTLRPGTNVAITPSGGNGLTIAITGVPGGTLPPGTAGQTLRSDGSGWLASSALTNDGTDVSITGNLNLPATTATTGQIWFAANPFIHNFGFDNAFLGISAGNFTMTGLHNTGVGANALLWNASGSSNCAFGAGGLFFNTSGGGNSAFGTSASHGNTSGTNNTAMGYNAAHGNTTANNNTAVGVGALYIQDYDNGGTPWDSDNTAVGFEALRGNAPTSTSNGIQNTVVGSGAMRQNTTGPFNTAIGYHSLYNNDSGSYNTAVGYHSLFGNTSGSNNIGVGDYTGYSNQTGSNNVFLGNFAGYGEMGSNRLYIANSSGTPLIFGEFDKKLVGINATDPLTEMDVNGKVRARDWTGTASSTSVCRDPMGVLVPCSSDERLKTNVAPLAQEKDVVAVLAGLRGVAFDWDRSNPKAANAGTNREIGFIAQEVEAVLPEVVHVEADGYRSMDYAKLTALLVEVAKAQQTTIQVQQTKLEAQQAQIEELKAAVAELNRVKVAVEELRRQARIAGE